MWICTRWREDEKVTAFIPVESTGEKRSASRLARHAGNTCLFKLKVRAVAKDLPEALIVDVSRKTGDRPVRSHWRHQPPEGVEILGDKHISVLPWRRR